MSDNTDSNAILNDIRTYLRINAASASKTTALIIFDTQEKAQVYQKLGERKSQIKIQAETGVPQPTINRWFNEFVEAGLAAEPNEFSTDYKALFSLRELGINIAELGKRKARQQAAIKQKQGVTAKTEEEKA